MQQGQASILESMAEGLYGTDAEGRITYANAAAEHLLGWSAGEMRGQFAHQMFHHTRADGTPYPVEDCPIHRACLTGQPCRSDDELFWRRDGSSFPVEMAGARIGTPERTVGSVVVFRDVTDQRSAKLALRANVERLTAINRRLEETQSQLLQSEKMASIGQLAAGVAHEINNPVAFVNANLSSLRCEVGDLLRVLDAYQAADPILAAHPAVMKTIAAARDAAELDYLRADIGALIDESLDGMQRVRKIVQDLKDFSRVGTAEWQFADLEDGLDSTLNIVWNEVKYKALVEKEYAGLPKVECIAAQIHQVFMNLLVNAAQAIESHGTITLRTGFAGAEVWVEVEDTGQGIPAHELSRIFDPFFTTKPVGKGTGLGLSLAYSIAQRHRGRIEVSSQVGVGSRFRLVLPAMRVQAEVSASGEATG
nr:ATP-binding protein [Candidatus Accumulibacter aalborgensis]